MNRFKYYSILLSLICFSLSSCNKADLVESECQKINCTIADFQILYSQIANLQRHGTSITEETVKASLQKHSTSIIKEESLKSIPQEHSTSIIKEESLKSIPQEHSTSIIKEETVKSTPQEHSTSIIKQETVKSTPPTHDTRTTVDRNKTAYYIPPIPPVSTLLKLSKAEINSVVRRMDKVTAREYIKKLKKSVEDVNQEMADEISLSGYAPKELRDRFNKNVFLYQRLHRSA